MSSPVASASPTTWSARPGTCSRWPTNGSRQVEGFDGIAGAVVESISEDRSGAPRSFQLQVDGDYIGERTRIELGVDPGALTILA
jgi:hypothetical protein